MNEEIDELIVVVIIIIYLTKRKKSISFQIHSTKRTQTGKKYVRKYTKKKKWKLFLFFFFMELNHSASIAFGGRTCSFALEISNILIKRRLKSIEYSRFFCSKSKQMNSYWCVCILRISFVTFAITAIAWIWSCF